MTKILVVYDNLGYVLYQSVGENPRVPEGVQYILADLPSGKQLKIVDGIGVDLTGSVPKLVFENVPKDATEMTVAQMQEQLQYVTFGLLELTFSVNKLKLTQTTDNNVIEQLANLLATIKGGA